MKFRTFKYHLDQGVRGMLKNGFMSLAAIATVVACSFILILSLCICMNIDYMLEQIEETIGITVFLGPNVSEEMAEEIGDRIRAIDHVTEVIYKSSDDNLSDAIGSWENSSILEGLRDDNPLPASYEVSLDGAKYQADVVKELEMLQTSVEAELNASLNVDEIERIYLDENGNEITREQAEELGIVESETTAEVITEIVTSGAETDQDTPAESSEASAGEAAQPAEAETAAATPAETAEAAEAAEAETTAAETASESESEAEEAAATYSSAPSEELLNILNSAVAATAGGNVHVESLDETTEAPSDSAEGTAAEAETAAEGAETETAVAGTDQYDASQYGTEDYEYKGIEKIKHATKEANTLVQVNTAVRIFSIIVVAILCVISISIIMNTIRLTVVIRKNEITIMKYVGATDWFIRWPFIIEGMLIGFIGSIIPTLLCFFGYTECIHVLAEKMPIIVNIVDFKSAFDVFIYVAPVTIIFGMLLGIIGSASSMRKYLRV
ncbi:MAG: permease-like cell division protein FtsX [Eubacterium sp.]|nr:permease-like cell division protein FtsX [Eubacterium sp.]